MMQNMSYFHWPFRLFSYSSWTEWLTGLSSHCEHSDTCRPCTPSYDQMTGETVSKFCDGRGIC